MASLGNQLDGAAYARERELVRSTPKMPRMLDDACASYSPNVWSGRWSRNLRPQWEPELWVIA